MAIQSSEYGLVDAEKEIQPYEVILTKERAEELLPQVIDKFQNYDSVLYYRGGAGKEYFDLIREACIRSETEFVSLGYNNLGDVNKTR